jgi:hypothetical protein
MIENLPLVRPDARRGAKTVARCHARLSAQRGKIEARNRTRNSLALGAERLLIAGCCVAYLIAMVGDVLAVAAGR